jgi:hypothetical protein
LQAIVFVLSSVNTELTLSYSEGCFTVFFQALTKVTQLMLYSCY